MSFFDFGPKPTTITTTFTPLGGRPFTTTFTVHGGIIPTGSIPFPNFNGILSRISDNGCGPGILAGPAGFGPPGPGQQGGPLCPGSAAPTANPPPGSPPLNPPSSTPAAPDSSAASSSQSGQESDSTTTDHSSKSTNGSGQPPSSTKSTDSTTGGFTATSSSDSSTSTSTFSVVVSLYPTLPAESLYTSSTSVSTSTQSSPATAAASSASGLSAGSAVGIALGVFVAAILLVVAALFLFLRQRKRRRDRYAAKRKLRWSEGGRSRALSSIWSWFGSLPIGSESDIGSAQEHKDARRRASQRLDDSRSEDPFQDIDMESNSDKSATMVAHGALSRPAASTVHVHEGVEQAHASPSQSGHEREGMEGAARLLALAATDYSASGALPFSSYTNPAASGLRAGHVSPDGHQVMADSERGRTRVQEARDPFADPGRPLSGFSQTLTVASSTEVQSVEAQ